MIDVNFDRESMEVIEAKYRPSPWESQLAERAAEMIHCAFSWYKSPQGYAYWADVYCNLNEIAKSE
jgi:hypothetical protein